jgi:hypothetical protein
VAGLAGRNEPRSRRLPANSLDSHFSRLCVELARSSTALIIACWKRSLVTRIFTGTRDSQLLTFPSKLHVELTISAKNSLLFWIEFRLVIKQCPAEIFASSILRQKCQVGVNSQFDLIRPRKSNSEMITASKNAGNIGKVVDQNGAGLDNLKWG